MKYGESRQDDDETDLGESESETESRNEVDGEKQGVHCRHKAKHRKERQDIRGEDKMSLGMEIGLGPGDLVLDGDPTSRS